MTKYYFKLIKPMRYNKKPFKAGIYETEDIEFVRNYQSIIEIISEAPVGVEIMNFETMQYTIIPIKIPVTIKTDVTEKVVKVPAEIIIDEKGDVEVKLETDEQEEAKLTLDEINKALDEFDTIEEITEPEHKKKRDTPTPI